MQRLGSLILFLAFAIGLVAAPTLRADDNTHPVGAGAALLAAEGHGAEDDGGIFGKALDLAIWTVVVFLILLFVLSKFAWKPILEGLQKREENIHAAVKEAQDAKDEAQRLRQQLQVEMNQAAEKVRDIIDAARKDAQHSADEMLAKAKSEIQTERDRLHREIGLARDQALQELWSQSAQLATLISSKAIRRHMNQDDHTRLVDESIAELRAAGSERRREVVAN
jgi:F-type H+-transporting ATPase subunit b